MVRQRLSTRRGKERGAAAVELALVLPLLLLLVFGVVQYGIYFWTLQGGSDIARNAARMSAVGLPADCTTFRQRVREEIDALNGAGAAASISRTYADAAPAGINVGDLVEVEVRFTATDLGLPFVPFVDGGVVTTTVESRVEFVPVEPEVCRA